MATRKPVKHTAIRFDLSAVEKMADGLAELDPATMRATLVRGLNKTLDDAYDLAHGNIAKAMNRTDAYITERMRKDYATRDKLQAEIVASSSRALMTRLASYDAQLHTAPVKINRKTRGKGLIPGLSPGQRQAGVSVTVRRGGTKEVDKGFLITLRHGTQDGTKVGVFKRERGKSGKIRPKHLYGPSIYQLFGVQAEKIRDDVLDGLEDTVLDFVQDEINKVL